MKKNERKPTIGWFMDWLFIGGWLLGLMLGLGLGLVFIRLNSNPLTEVTGTPDALATRWAAVEATQVALETEYVWLYRDVIAWATQCADATPTPVSVLCKPCKSTADCPQPDFFCKDCAVTGLRCVRRASPNSDCVTCRGNPSFVGIATHYDGGGHEGKATKSGEIYDANAMTCAVPWPLWDELKGKTLFVRFDDREVAVKVNDCGKLSEAGLFKWGIKDGVEWFWPSTDGYPVVVDLTPKVYALLDPQGPVQVWVEERKQ